MIKGIRRRSVNNIFTKFDKMDKILKSLVFTGTALLLCIQAAFLYEGTRPYLSRVDRIEGDRISLEFTQYAANPLLISEKTVVSKRTPAIRESRVLIIRMIQPISDERVYASINGEKAGDFGRGEVKLTVYDGDYVEINCNALKAKASFIVGVLGSGLAAPLDGLMVENHEGIATVGKIKFK